MAGHLHPLIIRLVLETVWMAGDSTSFDTSFLRHGLQQSNTLSSVPVTQHG